MTEIRMTTSFLGRTGPKYVPSQTPDALGWGSDEQVYPDRFVVNEADGAELVWVPAGVFGMGTLVAEYSDILLIQKPDIPYHATWLPDDERPNHKVRITKGFWLYKHTVTFGQCKHVLKDKHPQHRVQWRRMLGPGDTEIDLPYGKDYTDRHPMIYVDWDAAANYARQVGMTVPTEAQWEYAARGPRHLNYPWGNDDEPARCYNVNDLHGFDRTAPVETFPDGASWCGAQDMAGNVWEWCQDWFEPYSYDDVSTPLNDPRGTDASSGRRVMRGGSWLTMSFFVRCAVRARVRPDHTFFDFGFRCAAP